MEVGEDGFQVLCARREQALVISFESDEKRRRLISFSRRSPFINKINRFVKQ